MSEARSYGSSVERVYEPTVTRMKTVTVIPPRLQAMPGMPTFKTRPKRVAAYARVSINSEEQLTSYEAQVKHYTEYIKSKEQTDNWQFVSVYTDKGITGTSMKKRDGFNQMVADALDGKIDLIITKSVSRFARNTVDTLTTIRELKAKGVEVYFEEQNIYTLDGKGEVLLTIMSSIAQEESRNISENVTWGMRKRFADGRVSMPYKQFMGYRRGKNGIPEVVEAEAKIIRTISDAFWRVQPRRSLPEN
ncbi:MAG: recombinase family protein [Clostridia bacterium]|nr:recombinase family protein [Clostridia bacterium]